MIMALAFRHDVVLIMEVQHHAVFFPMPHVEEYDHHAKS